VAGIELTPEQVKLVQEPNFGALATVMPDGSPQVTILWVDYRDGLIWVNTQQGRAKPRNMDRDPRVALTIWDRDDPYERMHVRGRVVETTTEGAADHIRWLNNKYHGNDNYPLAPDAVRVIYKIEPEHVTS
jgi:PPOX class probable F420-dependent enzyme